MNVIDITGVDLKAFVKAVYALSVPKGLGFLHERSGELDDETAERIIEHAKTYGHLCMDYVHGRCCKMNADLRNGKVVIDDRWYDHSAEDLSELLRIVGMAPVNAAAAEGTITFRRIG